MKHNNIHVYTTKVDAPWDEKTFNALMALMPEELQMRVNEEEGWEARHGSLARKLLLWHGMNKLGTDMNDLFDSIQYEESGKPYIVDAPNFSLANDEAVAVCALSNTSVLGIDIERQKPINLTEFREQMTYAEWREIYSHVIPLRRFYEFWTIKESVLKADKFMRSFDLKEIFIQPDVAFCNGKYWYINPIETDYYGYICHAVTSLPHAEIYQEEVDLLEAFASDL
jgi:4'-phosphopantetheinyl transferase